MSAQIQRLSATLFAIGIAENVAQSLEAWAEKIRTEGEPVDLKATIRYQSKALVELSRAGRLT